MYALGGSFSANGQCNIPTLLPTQSLQGALRFSETTCLGREQSHDIGQARTLSQRLDSAVSAERFPPIPNLNSRPSQARSYAPCWKIPKRGSLVFVSEVQHAATSESVCCAFTRRRSGKAGAAKRTSTPQVSGTTTGQLNKMCRGRSPQGSGPHPRTRGVFQVSVACHSMKLDKCLGGACG